MTPNISESSGRGHASCPGQLERLLSYHTAALRKEDAQHRSDLRVLSKPDFKLKSTPGDNDWATIMDNHHVQKAGFWSDKDKQSPADNTTCTDEFPVTLALACLWLTSNIVISILSAKLQIDLDHGELKNLPVPLDLDNLQTEISR